MGEVTYSESFPIPHLLLSQLLKRGRGNEDDVRLEVGRPQNLERLRMQVEDADFARVDDTPDGFETRAVVRPLVLAVLDKLA